ncbi:hypothetical protein LGK97_04590 [Clostridium sp. CS001]|uniref:DUF7033 domain-containing protein n=1 Tax=Clostridium sp. CS001 TaxID=2880648 RepID=UPI001CF4A9D1|nr:hypothetical protein [Clostridium sp. CS001]MCB2289044.1 hypothetical protein [Clostridium sp. CS001]
MINFIIDKKLESSRKILYAIFYLTKDYDGEIKISSVHLEHCLNIYYGIIPKMPGNIYIPADNITINEKKVFYNEYKEKVFMSFDKKIKTPFYLEDGNLIYTFDILMLSFYLLSCKEEYEISKRDSEERFIAEYSYRSEKINIPFFDVNSYILYDSIKHFNEDLSLKKRQFEIFLNHDVDSINSRNRYVFLHNIKAVLFNKKVPLGIRAKELLLDVISNRHLQIENYIKIEKLRNAKSEFYFIEGIKHRLGKRYELSSIKKEIEMLREDSSFYIGVHVNFFSYNDENEIKNEIQCIQNSTNIKVISGKNHYLRFNVPHTWQVLSNAGILCDSTLGYSDMNGFRAGTSHAFIPYNIDKDELVPIFEVPLVIMDGIIMESQMTFEEKWYNIKVVIDEVISYCGTASVLWHQRVIYDKEYKAMYEKILDYINEQGGRFVLAKDLISRYEKQNIQLEQLFKDFENL